jgi:hypothetical protein
MMRAQPSPSRRRSLPRLLAFTTLVMLAIFPPRSAFADNRVRVLFDDVNDTYRPVTTNPNPPKDGCRPAVDDSDDNGCVTEAEADDDGQHEDPPDP